MEGLRLGEDEILLVASHIYEDSCLEKYEDDVLMQASQIYEDSSINNTSSSELEVYMYLREKYWNMDEDDFMYDRLIALLKECGKKLEWKAISQIIRYIEPVPHGFIITRLTSNKLC